MSELVEFSKMLIIKDPGFGSIPRYYCGEPSPWNYVAEVPDTSLARYHAGNPPGADISAWLVGGWGDLRPFILHSMGVEENNTLGYNRLPASSGTAIIVDDILYIGAPDSAGPPPIDYTYKDQTTFQSNLPNPALTEGDYIFWGDDPNYLNIGGKIKYVYTSGDPEYADGARYQFEKDTVKPFPTDSGDPIPQKIYYYRKSWNGKGYSNEVDAYKGGGFFVMIGVERIGSGYAIPWLNNGGTGSATSIDQIIDPSTGSSNPPVEKYAFTDLIRVKRISNKFKSDETAYQGGPTDTEEIIPCSIHRTSTFWYQKTGTITNVDANGNLNSFFTAPGQMPPFIAYYVNPYGQHPTNKLEKNTTYIIEINERLPALLFGPPAAQDTGLFNYAITGAI